MESNRLKLVLCTKEIIENILESDDKIANHLNINVSKNWSEFGSAIFQFVYSKVLVEPESVKWWTYLPIHIDSKTLIGSCGYKGPPNDKGEVEIGYEVTKSHRNKGYATEIAQHLIDIAFNEQQVKSILAHTLPKENASTKVLLKCKFKFVEEVNDPDDGLIWKWKLKRELNL